MHGSRYLLGSAHILAAVLIAPLAASLTTERQPRSQPTVRSETLGLRGRMLFTGRLKGAKVQGPNLPITYDAHVVVGARVDRLEFGKSPWPVGTSLIFVVRSLTRLFGSRFSGGSTCSHSPHSAPHAKTNSGSLQRLSILFRQSNGSSQRPANAERDGRL
jgi:hypothetical protein